MIVIRSVRTPILLLVACSSVLHGQIPSIKGVVNSANFDGAITWGGLVTLFGTDLGSQTAATSVPFPTQLGGTKVFVCDSAMLGKDCVQGGLVYASATQLNILMPDAQNPATSSVSTASFWVDVQGRQSTSFSTTVRATAARIFSVGYEKCGLYTNGSTGCFLVPDRYDGQYNMQRFAVTDSKGKLVLTDNPLRPNEIYSIWLTGTGKYRVPDVVVNFGVNATVDHFTGLIVSGLSSTVIYYAGPSPQFPGLTQINVSIPGTGCHSNGAEAYLQVQVLPKDDRSSSHWIYIPYNDCKSDAPSGGTAATSTIFDNTTGNNTLGGYEVGLYGSGSDTYSIGFAFRVPAGNDFVFTQGAYLASFKSGTNDLELSICSDVNGYPGAVLESFELPDVLTSSMRLIPFKSKTTPTLAGGRQYWLTARMKNPSASTSFWWGPQPGDPGWGAASHNGGPWFIGTGNRGAFQIFGRPASTAH